MNPMDLDEPLGNAFKHLDAMNAATGKMVLKDEDETPYRAVILVKGQPETSELLRALERVEDRWHRTDGSRFPDDPQEEDYTSADHEDLLHALVKHRAEGLKPPNAAWVRRYYQLTGEHYVLAQGFGEQGTDAWVKKETYDRITEDEDVEYEIFHEVNTPE